METQSGRARQKVIHRRTKKIRKTPPLNASLCSGITEMQAQNPKMDQIIQKNRDPSIERIYRLFKKISGGADGSICGVNGSIRPQCLARIFGALEIYGRELIDFGAGEGRVLAASLEKGAVRAYGYELPSNEAHRFVFTSVLSMVGGNALSRAQWISKDINDLSELPVTASCAFSFWVGIPLATQEKILNLCAGSLSITSLAVFRDSKWRHPEDGKPLTKKQAHLSQFGLPDLFSVIWGLENASSALSKWHLRQRITTAMHVSGQRHEAWVFQRQSL